MESVRSQQIQIINKCSGVKAEENRNAQTDYRYQYQNTSELDWKYNMDDVKCIQEIIHNIETKGDLFERDGPRKNYNHTFNKFLVTFCGHMQKKPP